MSLTQNVAFKLVELFENPDESVMRLAGDTPVLVVGNCCCCCCCHCNFSLSFDQDASCEWEKYAEAEGYTTDASAGTKTEASFVATAP